MRAGLLFLLVAFASCAPLGWERPLLWRIETTPPSYVLGTMHLKDRRVMHFPDPLRRALDAVGIVECELDMDRVAGDVASSYESFFLTYPQTLEPLLGAELTSDLRWIVEAAQGDWSQLRRFKPWAMTMWLDNSDTEVPTASPAPVILDSYLFSEAKRRGLQVGGIESVDDQLDGDTQPMDEQLKELKELIEIRSGRKPAAAKPLRRIVTAFMRGDQDRMLGFLQESSPWIRDSTAKRNFKMVEHIADRLRLGRAALFAVGAAHLPGPKGVLAGLRERGFDVVRVK